jgi:hypothetical protein
MRDPVEILLAAGWRRADGRWAPPADMHVNAGRLRNRNGYSLEDAFALNALIEATKRHMRGRGHG